MSARTTDQLLQAASHLEKPRRLGDLFMVRPPRIEALPAIHSCFERVGGQVSGYRPLATRELAEVLKAPPAAARDLFIGGFYDATTGTLSLTRGDFDVLVAPESIFKASRATPPNFSDLALTDYGHTIRLGAYEASSDSILYEIDPDYRKRLNKKRRETDKGFGPSLRRLRIQKGLSRRDFPRLTAKTIARIERGETDKPRGTTLAALARTLGVEPDQIESY
jgi:hypothetical protein